MLYRMVLTFRSTHKTSMYGYSYESYWAVVSCGAVYDAV